jgi:hypothetical protein
MLDIMLVVTSLGVVAGGSERHLLTKPFTALSKQRIMLPTTVKTVTTNLENALSLINLMGMEQSLWLPLQKTFRKQILLRIAQDSPIT